MIATHADGGTATRRAGPGPPQPHGGGRPPPGHRPADPEPRPLRPASLLAGGTWRATRGSPDRSDHPSRPACRSSPSTVPADGCADDGPGGAAPPSPPARPHGPAIGRTSARWCSTARTRSADTATGSPCGPGTRRRSQPDAGQQIGPREPPTPSTGSSSRHYLSVKSVGYAPPTTSAAARLHLSGNCPQALTSARSAFEGAAAQPAGEGPLTGDHPPDPFEAPTPASMAPPPEPSAPDAA